MSTNKVKSGSVKNAKPAPGAKTSDEVGFDLESIEVVAVSLHSLEFSNRTPKEKQAVVHKLACSIKNYVSQEERSVGFCEFSITRVDGDDSLAEVTASYLYVVDSAPIKDSAIRQRYVEHFARIGLWPRFKNLLGIINLQSDAEFPRLPMVIPSIAYSDVSDETSE